MEYQHFIPFCFIWCRNDFHTGNSETYFKAHVLYPTLDEERPFQQPWVLPLQHWQNLHEWVSWFFTMMCLLTTSCDSCFENMGILFKFLYLVFRINLDGNKLGPSVSYPVPVGTPLISPLVQWDHSQTWDVPKVEDFPSSSGGSASATVYNIGKKCSLKVTFTSWTNRCQVFDRLTTDTSPESTDSYMMGHCIDGRVLYPATGYLVLAWRTLARNMGVVMETTPVTFEDVTIHRATILPKTGKWRACEHEIVINGLILNDYSVSSVSLYFSLSGSVQLEVRLMPATNKFEISENGNLAVSGTSHNEYISISCLVYFGFL